MSEEPVIAFKLDPLKFLLDKKRDIYLTKEEAAMFGIESADPDNPYNPYSPY
jgi:hypothetical protein